MVLLTQISLYLMLSWLTFSKTGTKSLQWSPPWEKPPKCSNWLHQLRMINFRKLQQFSKLLLSIRNNRSIILPEKKIAKKMLLPSLRLLQPSTPPAHLDLKLTLAKICKFRSKSLLVLRLLRSNSALTLPSSVKSYSKMWENQPRKLLLSLLKTPMLLHVINKRVLWTTRLIWCMRIVLSETTSPQLSFLTYLRPVMLTCPQTTLLHLLLPNLSCQSLVQPQRRS